MLVFSSPLILRGHYLETKDLQIKLAFTLDFFKVMFCGWYHGIHHHVSPSFGRIFVYLFQASKSRKSKLLMFLKPLNKDSNGNLLMDSIYMRVPQNPETPI